MEGENVKDEMFDASLRWKELKVKFLREFLPTEQHFFLKQAREAVRDKGYPVGEDLFHYCYFLTLKERMRTICPFGGEGYMRYLFVEATRDIDREVRYFEKRLDEKKRPAADAVEHRLIERFLGS